MEKQEGVVDGTHGGSDSKQEVVGGTHDGSSSNGEVQAVEELLVVR